MLIRVEFKDNYLMFGDTIVHITRPEDVMAASRAAQTEVDEAIKRWSEVAVAEALAAQSASVKPEVVATFEPLAAPVASAPVPVDPA